MSTETQNTEPKNPIFEAQVVVLAEELVGRKDTEDALVDIGFACAKLGVLMESPSNVGNESFNKDDLALLMRSVARTAIKASGAAIDANDIARYASERAKEISFKDKLVDLVPALIPLFEQIAALSSPSGEHVDTAPVPGITASAVAHGLIVATVAERKVKLSDVLAASRHSGVPYGELESQLLAMGTAIQVDIEAPPEVNDDDGLKERARVAAVTLFAQHSLDIEPSIREAIVRRVAPTVGADAASILREWDALVAPSPALVEGAFATGTALSSDEVKPL